MKFSVKGEKLVFVRDRRKSVEVETWVARRDVHVWAARRRVLASLGFGDYRAYLESSFWKQIRRKVLKRDRWKCRFCGAKAEAVHHHDYQLKTLRGKRLARLSAVCRRCHAAASVDEVTGQVFAPRRANAVLRGIGRENGGVFPSRLRSGGGGNSDPMEKAGGQVGLKAGGSEAPKIVRKRPPKRRRVRRKRFRGKFCSGRI